MIKNSELSRVARLLNEFLMSFDWVQKPHTFFVPKTALDASSKLRCG
jgi:hypothetical protein